MNLTIGLLQSNWISKLSNLTIIGCSRADWYNHVYEFVAGNFSDVKLDKTFQGNVFQKKRMYPLCFKYILCETLPCIDLFIDNFKHFKLFSYFSLAWPATKRLLLAAQLRPLRPQPWRPLLSSLHLLSAFLWSTVMHLVACATQNITDDLVTNYDIVIRSSFMSMAVICYVSSMKIYTVCSKNTNFICRLV